MAICDVRNQLASEQDGKMTEMVGLTLWQTVQWEMDTHYSATREGRSKESKQDNNNMQRVQEPNFKSNKEAGKLKCARFTGIY